VPFTIAIERAERLRQPITQVQLGRLADRSIVRTRDRQLPGNHKREVEWNSLAGPLLGLSQMDDTKEPTENERQNIDRRKSDARAKKRAGRSPD